MAAGGVQQGERSAGSVWRALATGALCLLAFAGSAFVAGFVGFAMSLEREETTPAAQAEGVVALTGGSNRVLDATSFLARGQARRLLITGVNPATHGPDIARLLPFSKDLFKCCVDLGYEAQDTAGNAREIRDWARKRGIDGPLIIVTSNYHMPRALLEISNVMPGVTLFPFAVVSEHVDVADWASNRRVLRLVGREYLKYLRALLRIAMEQDAGADEPRAQAAAR